MRMCLICQPQWTYMSETNINFFMNKTAIEVTGPCKHWHHYIILTWRWLVSAGLITQTVVVNITRYVSLAVVFDLISFYFSSLADWISCKIQHSIKEDLCSRLCILFFISSWPHSTDIEWSLDFKLCSPYLFCLFKYFHLNSWVGCEMHYLKDSCIGRTRV